MSHTTIGVESNTPLNKKDEWMTTDYALKDALYLCGLERFDLDAATNGKNKIAMADGMLTDSLPLVYWFDLHNRTAWCNPPFSLKVEFLQKVYEQRMHGFICMMLPYEPATKWWRENVDGKASVVYVPDGRYNFIDPETGLEVKGVNFASAFVIFTSLTMPATYVQFPRGIGSKPTE